MSAGYYEFHLVRSQECGNNYTRKLRTESDLLNTVTPLVCSEKSKSCYLIAEELVIRRGKCLLPAMNLMSRCKDVLVRVYS